MEKISNKSVEKLYSQAWEQRYYISDKVNCIGFAVWERCSKEQFQEYMDLEKPCKEVLLGSDGAVITAESYHTKERIFNW